MDQPAGRPGKEPVMGHYRWECDRTEGRPTLLPCQPCREA